MTDRFSRTRLLVGAPGLERLRNAHVAVIGLGGVGGYALEALARAGVGRFTLVDADRIEITNFNRQILATEDTLGAAKVDAGRDRVLRINPDARVTTVHASLSPGNVETLLPPDVGYAVDAIDSVTAKVGLIETLYRRGVHFVTCMGAGNRLTTGAPLLGDISETSGCPLARAVRQQLRKLGIHRGVRCVYFKETAPRGHETIADSTGGERLVGTISYVPGMTGLMAAGVIIQDILGASVEGNGEKRTGPR
jgi:tRNA A37 threonylcarbamoyladenosine dehydratase